MTTEVATETAETVESTSTSTQVAETAGAKKHSYEDLEKFYDKTVRDNAKYRDQIKELKSTQTTLEEQASLSTDLQDKLTKAEQASNERLAKAEFRGRLRAEGITDADVLKLMNLSDAKVGEDGEIENADELWDNFKTAKAYLFGAKTPVNTSSSSVSKTPDPQLTPKIDWMTATAEEAAAARRPSKLQT